MHQAIGAALKAFSNEIVPRLTGTVEASLLKIE
jgi:hypothetical protein